MFRGVPPETWLDLRVSDTDPTQYLLDDESTVGYTNWKGMIN